MKIRIEFSESKSKAYAWVVRLCKKQKSYEETVEAGMTIHSIELDFKKDWQTYEVISERLRGWSNTAFYLDGALLPAWKIDNLMLQKAEKEDEQARQRRRFGIPDGGRVDIDEEHLEGEKN